MFCVYCDFGLGGVWRRGYGFLFFFLLLYVRGVCFQLCLWRAHVAARYQLSVSHNIKSNYIATS